MATMARTGANSALLKKMDPAPARLVARHSATTARLQPRRPIDTHHRAPAPTAAKTLTPRAPTPRPAPQNSPNNAHNPNTRPQHNPTSKPATRNHTKKHNPEPLTNSRERSGLVVIISCQMPPLSASPCLWPLPHQWRLASRVGGRTGLPRAPDNPTVPPYLSHPGA